MFSSDLGQIMNTHHMIWRMYESGLAGEDLVHLCDQVLIGLISSPGGQQWWATAKAWYQPNYQAFIDAKLAEGASYPMQDFLSNILRYRNTA